MNIEQSTKDNSEWHSFIKSESDKEYFKFLVDKLDEEYNKYTIYPQKEDILNAYWLTEPSKVKVVILGQDPYHEPNQANGLAFSVNEGVKIPPSLRNIYKEIENDIGKVTSKNGDLTFWAKQGVFLLNTVLTVRKGEANSHKNIGWETFTDNTIKYLNDIDSPKVFILWGNNARKKKNLITNKNHLILESAHPSPLSASRGFFGNNHFSKTNNFLLENKLGIIEW